MKKPTIEQLLFTHAQGVLRAAHMLHGLLTTETDGQGRGYFATEVVREEHVCDQIMADIYATMNAAFITDIDKPDIEALAQAIDTAVDEMKRAAEAVVDIYKPTAVPALVPAFGMLIEEAATALAELTGDLGNLKLETVRERVSAIELFEGRADDLLKGVLANLVGAMKAARDAEDILRWMDASMDFLMWKNICVHLEKVTDHLQHAANIISTIARKGA